MKKRIHDSRVDGTRKLVQQLRGLRHKPSVLVSASAIGYYGDRGDEVLDETKPPGNDFLADVCKEWEREATRARELGLRVVPIRIATVLGREGGALKAMMPVFRSGLGGKFGSGKQWTSWIHVDDLVKLFLFAADNTAIEGVLNGSSPQPLTNAQFTVELGRTLHRPAALPAPKFAMRLILARNGRTSCSPACE